MEIILASASPRRKEILYNAGYNFKVIPSKYDEKISKEAINMLLNLSDREHFVASSICLIYKDKILSNTQKTFVTFRKLTQEDIEKYIEEKKPFDKAGSYGIQDENFNFATKITGDLDNVIGFPMKLFEKMLSEITN